MVSADAQLPAVAAGRESAPCALCGGEDFQPVLEGVEDLVWRKPGRFTLARCAGCGLVMTRPRPDPGALAWYYQDAYSGDSEPAKNKREGARSPINRMLNGYRLHVISKVRPVGEADHVLDVGCSYGGFLWLARERTGCRASGVELDAGSVAEALEPEAIDYRQGTLLSAGYAASSFTVVSFLECLEHDPTPVDSLKEAWRVLEPGGVVAVEVPNFQGFWRHVFGRYWLPLLTPQHLVHFTPRTLRRALEQAGFEVVHRQTMFFPLEGVASFALWLGKVLRVPPPGSPPSWRTPFDLLLVLLVAVLYFLVEIPSQLLLVPLERTGHVLMVGRKSP